MTEPSLWSWDVALSSHAGVIACFSLLRVVPSCGCTTLGPFCLLGNL